MAFDAYGATQKESTGSSKEVDFDALNRSVVEQCKLQEREVIVGYVAQIVDLGTQDLPDAENVFTGTPEQEAAEIAKYPDTYFKDGIDPETRKPARLKCYPQKPQQCVAFAIDFPDIIVDKGVFFGESKPLPLRLWMGGQFYMEGTGMVMQRPTPLRVVNLDKSRATKKWSMAQNSMPYKMAVAAKIIKPGEEFKPQRIDELLGKAFQFEAQVFFKESKGKEYYTEYVKFVGALGRNNKEPEKLTTPYLVQFNSENSAEAIKELRAHIINTIKRASNYEGSKIKAQIEEYRGSKPAAGNAEQRAAPARPAPVDDGFDSDIPFAPIGLQEGKLFLHMI